MLDRNAVRTHTSEERHDSSVPHARAGFMQPAAAARRQSDLQAQEALDNASAAWEVAKVAREELAATEAERPNI